MLAHVIVAVVASVLPLATYFGVRHQRSLRAQGLKTEEFQAALNAIRRDFKADITQISGRVDSLRAEVGELKGREDLLREVIALQKRQVTP